MQLNHQVFPEPDILENSSRIPLIIIPGLFGSISNWRSVATKMAESRPVIVLDQRNHGRSPHADSHSYHDMVMDLLETIKDLGFERIHLAGHSMGGKVAMLFALDYSQCLESLTILDIAPVTYNTSHAPFLESLLELNLSTLKSRSEADEMLEAAIPDKATRLFLLQSLTGSPGSYRWRLNLKVLHEYMPQIVSFPEVNRSNNVPTLILGGQLSTYLGSQHHAKLSHLFPNNEIVTIPQAGHWLHAEQPGQVIEKMEEFLQK